MPGIDGFAFLEWLQQEPEITRAPTIVLTASSDRDSVRRAASPGISGYVVKPFDADDLRQRLRDLLDSAPAAQFI